PPGPAHEEEVPGSRGAAVVVVHFQDQAVFVLGDGRDLRGALIFAARTVGAVLAARPAAVLVVRQCGVDLAGHRGRFDVLGPVHAGRAEAVRGETGVDAHFGGVHALDVGFVFAVGVGGHQRQPFDGAVEGPVLGQLAGTV